MSQKRKPDRKPRQVQFKGRLVYVARMVVDRPYYKIGVANDIRQRMMILQLHSPVAVDLVHTIRTDNSEMLEKAIHKHFETHWVRGEWFTLTDADIAILKSFGSVNYGTCEEYSVAQNLAFTPTGRLRRWPPLVTVHRSSGRARIRVLGRDYYLGLAGSEQAEAAYKRIVRMAEKHRKKAVANGCTKINKGGRPSQWPPKMHHHVSGRARIRVDGRDYYLGLWGSTEADDNYNRIVKTIENQRQNGSPTK